jgi:hypothetical protein
MSIPAAHDTQLRIVVEQIDAVFRFVALGVCGAGFSAIGLTLVLFHLGFVAEGKGLAWSCFILACAAGHIALFAAYRRSENIGVQWRYWAVLFSLISFAEGVGWGWAPIELTNGAALR